jgi:phosphoglycolate phosphatase
MKYSYVLFDLDGTLTDSKPGIINCAIYALEHFGVTGQNPEEMNFFVGPPLLDSFMQHYGFDEETARKLIVKYRERYSAIGLFENAPFEGVHKMLAKLKEAGLTLAVATSKPHELMLRILEKYELAPFFTAVEGAKFDSTSYKKAMVLQEVFEDLGLQKEDYSKVLMVGDRFHDIEAAKDCGVDSMGVLYGYGDREELERYGADYIAETMEDITKIILG